MSYIEKEGIRLSSSTLEELEDTNISNPSDGQATIYDATDGKWKNKNIPLPADMIGAAAAVSGSHGLVPAPAAGDNAKFLRGDGTWQNTPVEANPIEAATAELNKLKVLDGVYSVGNAHFMPISQEDYDALTDEEIHNGTIYFIYDAPALEVTANPEDDPEEPLIKLSIDGVIYYVPNELPEVTSEDAGKVLMVNNEGVWTAANETTELPAVTASDNGKILSVVDGVWAKANPHTPSVTLVPWSSGSDQEITDMINSYYNGEITLEAVKSVWSIGDVRNVDISAMAATGVGESHRAQTVQMEILDFDHDTLTTPIGSITKALITCDLKNCLRDANVTDTTGESNTEHGYMNSSDTNVGGWTSCARRTWCNNVFYNALPSYFKSLVKPVDKLTSAGNQSSIINTDSDYCFLLSEIEIFGNVTYSKAGEGTQYAWFANATANRYKLPKWDSSDRVSDLWWERSPTGSNSDNFCIVSSGSGSASNGRPSSAFGLAPACCL